MSHRDETRLRPLESYRTFLQMLARLQIGAGMQAKLEGDSREIWPFQVAADSD